MRKKPNVILINCDDLGYGDVGCYGSTLHRTPNIDRLAREGLRFTDYYAGSPVCSPSRGSLMCGCYPPRIGFGDLDGQCVLFPGDRIGLHQDEQTLPRMLKDAGYHTLHVGKWHCGDQPEFLPTKRGFDEYFGLPFSNDMGRQVDTPPERQSPPLPLLEGDQVLEQQPDQEGLTERYTFRAVEFMRRHRDQPFFIYLAHMHVHLPLYAAQRFLRESLDGRYGACVEAVDWSTGVLLRELADLGLDEDTMIIWTSDNGSRNSDSLGPCNGPLRGEKGTCFEGGIRVPCLVRWPAGIQPGQVTSEMAAMMDWLPTLASICGGTLQQDRPIDGLDISPVLLGQPGAKGRETYFYYWMNQLHGVRKGPWKLHLGRRGEQYGRPDFPVEELYHLGEDIGETQDLLAQHPEVVGELMALAGAMRADLGDDLHGQSGTGRRMPALSENAKPLTAYDPTHPYIMALYDLPDRG